MTEPALLSLRDIYAEALSRAGSLTPEAIQSVMEANEELGESLHLQSLEALSVKQGVKMSGTTYVQIIDGVAVIDLIGPIFPRANMMTMSGATSIATFTKDFLMAYASDEVRAIVLNIDSPGGDVRGIGESAQYVYKASRKRNAKPIKTYAAGYMASAAYYVGSATKPGNIFANRSALVGSIGVVLTAMKKDQETVEIVSSVSPNKRPDVSSEDGRSILQQQVDDLAEHFVMDVAKHRSVSKTKVLEDYGKGAVFVGTRALGQGLIDSVAASLSEVIEEAGRESFSAGTSKTVAVIGSQENILSEDKQEVMAIADLVAKLGFGPKAKDENEPTGNIEDNAATEQPKPSREELVEKYEAQGELFARDMLTNKRIFPASMPSAALALINAKADDEMFGGSVPFVNEEGVLTEGTREDAVRATYMGLTASTFTEEAIKGMAEGKVKGVILPEAKEDTSSGPKVMTKEEREALLALTPDGQKVLQARNNGQR